MMEENSLEKVGTDARHKVEFGCKLTRITLMELGYHTQVLCVPMMVGEPAQYPWITLVSMGNF